MTRRGRSKAKSRDITPTLILGVIIFVAFDIISGGSSSDYTLTVTSTLGGSISPAPGAYYYQNNTRVNFSATPSSGYTFSHWEVNGVTTTSSPTSYVILNGDTSIHATFTNTNPQTVVVNSPIQVTSSFDGGGNTYTHGPSLGDRPLFQVSGVGVTLRNVVIDDGNQATGTWATITLSGSFNVVEDITINNCQRYAAVFSHASFCTFKDMTITKCQHGIGGSSGDIGDWYPSTDCVIENCNISGMIIDGIKLKNVQRLTVRNNQVDVYPSNPGYINIPTSDSRYGQTYSKSGIYVASTDTASKDCTITGNHVFQSQPTPSGLSENTGILLNPDQTAVPSVYSSGNRVQSNTLSGMHYGILLKGDYYTVTGNTFTDVSVPIIDTGEHNVVS